MKYDPKDASGDVLPNGTYDFEIVKVEETTSKSSGNEMLDITLKLYGPGSKTNLAHDYIVNPTTLFKLKKLCAAVGLSAEFERGMITPDMLMRKTGRAEFRVDEDKTGQYDDKNVVKKYLPGNGKQRVAAAVAADPLEADLSVEDDSIPF